MKIRMILMVTVVLFGLMIAGPVSAHFLWMEPTGEQPYNDPGDTVSVDVYLHAEHADGLQMWFMCLGFDDTAVDGAELTYIDINYGDTVLPPWMPATYKQGGSLKHEGESQIYDISRLDWVLSEMLDEGEDFLLFTANFTFDSGVYDNEDIWIEWRPGIDGFGFDVAEWHDTLEIYTDNTKTTLLGDGGPDYAQVPVPAAVWLLGSGLLGLVGIRRRRRKI